MPVLRHFTSFKPEAGVLGLPLVHNGRFPVGITTFVTPVQPPRTIGSIKLRTPAQGKSDDALVLEEVAFTAYYPTAINPKSKKGVPWFLRPLNESLQGFATFLGLPRWLLWPIVYFFGALLRIPGYPNAPLLNPKTASTSQWPLVIFSHGLGGNRTTYSQFCSRLAASGKVVLAIEHRDGTGTFCLPRAWTNGQKGKSRTLLYLREQDVHFDDTDATEKHPIPLRGQQLAFRREEVHITYSAFVRFMQGDATLEFDTIDSSPFDRQSWTSTNDGVPLVRYDSDISLTGHSFGGCTVLSLLATEPLNGYPPLNVERAVVLDPWLEPLPSPGPVPFTHSSLVESALDDATSPKSTDSFTPDVNSNTKHSKMLVINSETFTLWKDHYARLKESMAQWGPTGGRILTLVDSVHVSFSDFPILPIFKRKNARPMLESISALSLAFLDDRLDEELKGLPTKPIEIKVIGVKKDGKPKRKLVGNPGDIIEEKSN